LQLDTFFQYIYGFFDQLITQPLQSLGIDFGPGDWFFIIYTLLFVLIIGFLVRRSRGIGRAVPAGVARILASAGDSSGAVAGVRQLKFIRRPAEALVFLKIEENAVQQALAAVDYYASQGEIDDSLKEDLVRTYQARLDSVRAAIAKDEELREAVETSSAVDRARSDYLRKLAAMSGTTVESDGTSAGPTSVGMPAKSTTAPSVTPSAGPPSGGPPGGKAPSGGPPSGGAPAGGAPSGGPPGGKAPSGGPPGGGPPSGGPPSGGPPAGGAPSGGPPSGGAPSAGVPSGGPPSATAASKPPTAAGPPGGSPTPLSSTSPQTPSTTPSAAGPRSSLQSEMLAEMERLKALMSGD
jgi:hypothetical protein